MRRKPFYITTRLLNRMGACNILEFKKLFPKGKVLFSLKNLIKYRRRLNVFWLLNEGGYYHTLKFPDAHNIDGYDATKDHGYYGGEPLGKSGYYYYPKVTYLKAWWKHYLKINRPKKRGKQRPLRVTYDLLMD